MSWEPAGDGWQPDTTADAGGDVWGSGGDTGNDAGNDAGYNSNHGGGGGNDSDQTCRICHQTGHFARECPDKPEGGGLTGECYNCGQVGHNSADCTNERVERPFSGTCNSCGEEGHVMRNCPTNPQTCKLCGQPGHKVLECKSRRIVNWTGVPELSPEVAWTKLVDAAKVKDLDLFRTALKSYARALEDEFSIQDVEMALRMDKLPVYLIAKKQQLDLNMTIVDLIGNAERQFVLTIQLAAKPRRAKWAEGWPESPEQNIERLASCGLVQDRGVPVCSNCKGLGHVKKYCTEEVPEHASHTPAITCVYCSEVGHRARDCPKPRVNPYACRNCGEEGHNSKECEAPRSAANVECRKCNQMGHFSKECPNVEARKCNNCDSTDHIAKECPEPRNPAKVTCRNCEKVGHFSRDCPEPKDWSKVQCSNCQLMGHTIKRCKVPIADQGGAGDGGAVGGWNIGASDAAPAVSGGGEDNAGAGGGW